jgi:hypothetical protein
MDQAREYAVRVAISISLVFGLAGGATPVAGDGNTLGQNAEAPFLAENDTAMVRMMSAMEIQPDVGHGDPAYGRC